MSLQLSSIILLIVLIVASGFSAEAHTDNSIDNSIDNSNYFESTECLKLAVKSAKSHTAHKGSKRKGRKEAHRAMSYIRDGDFSKAHSHLARHSHYPEVQTVMGLLYEKGIGVERDSAKALDYYRRAALADLDEAQSELGHFLLLAGEAMEEDLQEAIKWLRKAADAGVVEAQLTLGKLYLDGKRVSRDYPQAIRWLVTAERNGSYEARKLLESIPATAEVRRSVEDAHASLRMQGSKYERGMGNITRSWKGYADIVNELNTMSSTTKTKRH